MRWPLLLLLTGASSGVFPKEVEIPCATWFEGHITAADVIVIAEVAETESEVVQLPGKALLKEACVMRIADVIGDSPKLRQATTIRLRREYPHDPYEQIDPEWGSYRHLRKGEQAVLLIHFYENDLAIGSDAVIALNEETRSLPAILRRTGLDFSLCTDADLAVWKAASPRMYPELAARVVYERELREEQRKAAGGALGEWLAVGCLVMGAVFVASRMWVRTKRR